MKLGLGTAQFGLDYGATNTRGKIEEPRVRAILDTAAACGIDLLDTAAAYGDAECVIGRAQSGPDEFRVVTKAGPTEFAQSLARLRVDCVYGLLAHNSADLVVPGGLRLAEWLLEQRSAGRAVHVGASVYTPEEAREIFERHPFDLIQLPLNVLNQRMFTSGVLTWLAGRNVEIHVRSAFLQGVLIASAERLPCSLAPLLPALLPFWSWLDQNGVSPLRATLGFVASACPEATVICGVTSVAELVEIAAAARAPWGSVEDFASFAFAQTHLIDPKEWCR